MIILQIDVNFTIITESIICFKSLKNSVKKPQQLWIWLDLIKNDFSTDSIVILDLNTIPHFYAALFSSFGPNDRDVV